MDIQPCGSNESVAYYIAKYMAKSEHPEVHRSITKAIQQIQRGESNISLKLFKVCMKILNERQVSACECAFLFVSPKLTGKFMNVCFFEHP